MVIDGKNVSLMLVFFEEEFSIDSRTSEVTNTLTMFTVANCFTDSILDRR